MIFISYDFVKWNFFIHHYPAAIFKQKMQKLLDFWLWRFFLVSLYTIGGLSFSVFPLFHHFFVKRIILPKPSHTAPSIRRRKRSRNNRQRDRMLPSELLNPVKIRTATAPGPRDVMQFRSAMRFLVLPTPPPPPFPRLVASALICRVPFPS